MTGRNEPCWCESGRKYKHCHHKIDSATGAEKYRASQEAYALNWRSSAEQHAVDGVYEWLSDQLRPWVPARILDVGCGSGHGLVALRRAFPSARLIGTDENLSCLRISEATLLGAGEPQVAVAARMDVDALGNGFVHSSRPLPVPLPSGVALLESDVCNDPYLADALLAEGPFDAVTVWLTGVHMMRQENLEVRRRGVDTDGAHRLYVQNNVYELAHRILRPGGVLQVADRGESPESDLLRQDILAAHAEQASVTNLKVQNLEWRPYAPPSGKRAPLRETRGVSGRQPSGSLAVVSITSVRP